MTPRSVGEMQIASSLNSKEHSETSNKFALSHSALSFKLHDAVKERKQSPCIYLMTQGLLHAHQVLPDVFTSVAVNGGACAGHQHDRDRIS